MLHPITPDSSDAAGRGDRLFDAAFLSRLERLHLIARRLFSGKHRADRRSRRTGSSLEFADYRNYSAGDDLRGIDWNIYARLDRLFLKMFEEEEDMPVHLLIDSSASMQWSPDSNSTLTKFDFACRVAASLAYIALSGLEQVHLQFFGGRPGVSTGILRGRMQFHNILAFLARAPQLEKSTALAPALRALGQRHVRRGILILLSDMLDPEGYATALQMARNQGFDVQVIHIMHPKELNPDTLGDWRFEDCESGRTLEMTVTADTLNKYRREMEEYIAGLERFCLSRQMGMVRAMSDMPFEDLVLHQLRRRGVLK